jgi:hypothetical protein
MNEPATSPVLFTEQVGWSITASGERITQGTSGRKPLPQTRSAWPRSIGNGENCTSGVTAIMTELMWWDPAKESAVAVSLAAAGGDRNANSTTARTSPITNEAPSRCARIVPKVFFSMTLAYSVDASPLSPEQRRTG